MAKKRARRGGKKRAHRTGKKRASHKKKRTRRGRQTAEQTLHAIKARLNMHTKASELPDFHGGRLPIKSGCGRPRRR